MTNELLINFERNTLSERQVIGRYYLFINSSPLRDVIFQLRTIREGIVAKDKALCQQLSVIEDIPRCGNVASLL